MAALTIANAKLAECLAAADWLEQHPAQAVDESLRALISRLNKGLHAVQTILGSLTSAPADRPATSDAELVIYRNPDASTEIDLFIGGKHCNANEFHVDPLYGSTEEDWNESRDQNIAAASAAASARLTEIYSTVRPTFLHA